MKEKFSWQDDYFAVSVSESQVQAVVNFIKNQELHHSKKTFAQEVDEFMIKYGWETVKDFREAQLRLYRLPTNQLLNQSLMFNCYF